jgi:hypothetical protein
MIMSWPKKPTGMKWRTDAEGQAFVEVDDLGVFVVRTNEPTPSKLNDSNGHPVTWPSVRKLTLGDDLIVYGCADCDYCAKSPDSIRPHRNKHRQLKTADDDVTAILRSAIRSIDGGGSREVEKLTAKVDRVTADRDAWKRRALDAERALSALRQAVSQVMESSS